MAGAKRWAFAALFIVAVTGCAAALVQEPPTRTLAGDAPTRLDLSRPDAWIESESLSALPAALIKAPLLKDLLSEDFAFYYRDLDTRLDVAGAIKRLAFERDLTLTDRLIDSVLDEPAEVALWREPGGRLRHWLLAVSRNDLAKLLQGVAKVALDDSQLSRVGELKAVDGAAIPLYALSLNSRDTLLFAAQGDRLVVLSSPSLLLDAKGALLPEQAATVAGLLNGDASPYARHFATPARRGHHRLTVGMDTLAQGYGRFLPELDALRFEQTDKGWATEIQRTANTPATPAPWAAMPHDAAFCSGLALDRAEADHLLAALDDDQAGKPIAQGFSGAMAICWYHAGGWQAPLFAARLSNAEEAKRLAPRLGELFERWIGAREFAQAEDRFPVRASTGPAGETIYRREVSARYGDLAVPAERAAEFSAANRFDVTLAVAGETVLFSPSAALAEKALDTLALRSPALSERLGGEGRALFLLDPPRLAAFLERTTLEALPAEREPALRRIAADRLLPRYAALAGHAAVAATLPAGQNGTGWTALDWRPLK